MKNKICEYNISYQIDLTKLGNNPHAAEAQRLWLLYNNVSNEQVQNSTCKSCFDTGCTTYLYIDENNETRQAYALCTCEVIKNIVH